MTSANRLYETRDEALRAPAGVLHILFCRACGFVFNAAFDVSLVPYGDHYENNQSNSGLFLAHMKDMASRVRAAIGDAPLRAVEIGCGQGHFLRLLGETSACGEDLVAGFDPSYTGADTPQSHIYKEFFGKETLERLSFRPNAVVSRHVIEHIQNPPDLLNAVKDALALAPEARVFFETPCIDWIFRNNAFWDLCYEHCSYFTAETLAYAFRHAGFSPLNVSSVFGGQYLWIEAAVAPRAENQTSAPNEENVRAFSAAVTAHLEKWRAALSALSARGEKVAVWGASTKGATFVQETDPEAAFVHCLIDINPLKQNRHIPITGHRVAEWQTALADGVSTIVLTNPNYTDEIKSMLGDRARNISFLSL